VEDIIGHRRDNKKGIEFHVHWSISDTTWETAENCKELVALDRYLELHGITNVGSLPMKR
jgi:hypothetical protein